MCAPIWKQFDVCTYLEAVLCVHLSGSSFMCAPIWKLFFGLHLSRTVNINVCATVDRMKVHIHTVML